MVVKQNRQDRIRILLEAAIRAGEGIFDSEFGLCLDMEHSTEQHIAERYRGHFVAWQSPAYAEALLAAERDVPRAARIIERICDFQDTDIASPSYGNFRAVAEWDRVRDGNAGAFLAVDLGYLWILYRDLLSARTKARLRSALDALAIHCLRTQTVVFYTNVYLLRLAGKLLLASILEREELARVLELEWGAFMRELSENNLSEYNSPGYNSVHVRCLLTIRDFALGPRMRRQAKAVLDYVLSLHCLHYHRPSRSDAGVMARAYRNGLLTHLSGNTVLNYALFGEPLPDRWQDDSDCGLPLEGVAWSRFDYEPPLRLRRLFLRKGFPLTIKEQVVSHWGRDTDPKVIRCTSHQTESYSLSTQYGVWANYGHYLPFHFTHAGPERRRVVFFQHEPHYPLIDAWLEQDETKALGAFFWGLPDYETFRAWWNSPPFEAALICHLGVREEMLSLLLDGQEWDGRSQPRIGSMVFVRKHGVAFRMTFITPPEDIRTPAFRMCKVQGGVAIRLMFARSKSADRFWRMRPSVLPVLFEVFPSDCDPGACEAPSWRLRENGTADLSVGALSVRVPLTLEWRKKLADASTPPIRGPFVESPYLAVRSSREMANRVLSAHRNKGPKG